MNQRIGKASTNFGRLSSRVWKNYHLAIKLKIRVYTACILIVLLYSSGTWCMYRCQENRLKCYCRCHHRCLVEGSCPNSTILHLTGSHDLITIMASSPAHMTSSPSWPHHRLTWPHHHHEATTSALVRPRPSSGRWSFAQGYLLRRVL